MSIAGTLTAGNIDGSGNSYPSNPSVHSITVTNTATATTVKTNNLNSTDGAPIDIQAPIVVDEVHANEYKTTEGHLFMSAMTAQGDVEVFFNEDVQFNAGIASTTISSGTVYVNTVAPKTATIVSFPQVLSGTKIQSNDYRNAAGESILVDTALGT